MNMAKSAAVVGSGVAALSIVPNVDLVINLVAGLAATLSMQPVVSAKLAVQRSPEQKREDETFFKREFRLLKEEYTAIIKSEDAFSGGVAYASRGALTKALMFFGFDNCKDLLNEVVPTLNTHLQNAVAGGVSGAGQGAAIALLEKLASRQSLYPDKRFAEHVSDMKAYQKEHGFTWPIGVTAARNSVFDSVFNVLKETGVPYGVASVVSMSASYLFEKSRSMLHQDKTPEDVKVFFKEKFNEGKAGAEDVFKGWGAKAAEFALVYFLLQTLKSYKAWLEGDAKKDPAEPKADELRKPEEV
jgi:hypothetical protein